MNEAIATADAYEAAKGEELADIKWEQVAEKYCPSYISFSIEICRRTGRTRRSILLNAFWLPTSMERSRTSGRLPTRMGLSRR